MSFTPRTQPWSNNRLDVGADDLARIEDNAADADARLADLESFSPTLLVATENDVPAGTPAGTIVVVKA